MRFSLAVLFTVGPLIAAPVPKDFKKPDDQARMVGTWKTVKILGDRGEQPIVLHTLVFTPEEKAYAVYHEGLKDVKWVWRLDSNVKPKRLSLILDGPNGTGCEGAYEFRDGKLHVGFLRDIKQPTYSTEPGPNVTLHVFERSAGK